MFAPAARVVAQVTDDLTSFDTLNDGVRFGARLWKALPLPLDIEIHATSSKFS